MKVDLILLNKICKCISTNMTGNPDCMAEKLGISRRFLYLNIDYLKSEFNAPIAYSRSRETFFLTEKWDFYVGDLNVVKAKIIKEVLVMMNKV